MVLLIVRYLAIYISTYKGSFSIDDKQVLTVMMPRGLAAAILAISFTPLMLGAGTSSAPGYNLAVEMQGIFMDVAFVVILGTAIITTIGVFVICHYETKKTKESEKE